MIRVLHYLSRTTPYRRILQVFAKYTRIGEPRPPMLSLIECVF
jgi:hypothetical protein